MSVCSAEPQLLGQLALFLCSAAEMTKITQSAGLYLYKVFVDPFREGFLLHSVSFICENKRQRRKQRKDREEEERREIGSVM